MKNLTEQDFDGNSYRGAEKTVVLFHARWCPYCRRFVSGYEKLVSNLPMDAALVDISDTGSKLWDNFSIDVVPTAIVFEKGKVVSRLDGIPGIGLRDADFKAFVGNVPHS
jgi:thioredoxin-like negative regulator of GroEL